MNELQVWVLIGVFAAIMVGGFTITSTLMMHAMNARFDGVMGTMNARFAAVDTRFDSVEATMNARFAAVEGTMNARFEAVNAKIDQLDGDVTAISRSMFRFREE